MKNLFFAVLLCATTIMYAQNEYENKEGYTLSETFQGYLQSATNRDYESLKTYFTLTDTLPFVDTKGKIRLSMDEYLEHQKGWIADTAWNYKSTIVSVQEYAETGVIVDNALFYGTNWEYPMVVTYIFRKEDEMWRLVGDICTEIKQ